MTTSDTRRRRLIDLIVGARPNFVKAAPVYRAFRVFGDRVDLRLVHTGQHSDPNMSAVFLEELTLPKPDVFLSVGQIAAAAQVGAIITRYDQCVLRRRPDLTVVFGDVNSAMACTVAAVNLGVPVAHVEAGLRSFDRTMPEERNRVVIDHLADLLFTPSQDANDNLEHEGIPRDRVHLVGNVMIDSLVACRDAIERSTIISELGLAPGRYALLTLHRPSNVDGDDSLIAILNAIEVVQRRLPVVFPVHPRTRQRLETGAFVDVVRRLENVLFLEPYAYRDFLRLVTGAAVVITDSGGIQEETTFLGVPCLTVRSHTERPSTIDCGTNTLVGIGTDTIVREAIRVIDGHRKTGEPIPLWDGRAAERIETIVGRYLHDRATTDRPM